MARFIFNTSFYVNSSQFLCWEQWIRTDLFPAVEKVLPDIRAEMFEVVSEQPNENRIFSVQWRCGEVAEVELIDNSVATVLQRVAAHFGEAVTHFSSIMEKKV